MAVTRNFTYEGRELEAMSHAVNYHAWIRDRMKPYLGFSVLEVGAGCGDFTRLLLDAGVTHVTSVEPDAQMASSLSEEFGEDERVVVVNGQIGDLVLHDDDRFDAAVYVNVLEHIEDDRSELQHAHAMIRPGGHLCIFVPALPGLYSAFDASVGHHRRYTRDALRSIVESAGFRTVEVRYMDLAGIIPWWLVYVLGRRTVASTHVRLYDRAAIPIIRQVEDRVPMPFGKNLFLIAQTI